MKAKRIIINNPSHIIANSIFAISLRDLLSLGSIINYLQTIEQGDKEVISPCPVRCKGSCK